MEVVGPVPEKQWTETTLEPTGDRDAWTREGTDSAPPNCEAERRAEMAGAEGHRACGPRPLGDRGSLYWFPLKEEESLGERVSGRCWAAPDVPPRGMSQVCPPSAGTRGASQGDDLQSAWACTGTE